MKLSLFIITFLVPLMAFATLEVGVETESVENKALVKLKVKNNFKQSVKSARAWVVLMDDDGKIVGQKAQWLSGKDKSKKQNAKSAEATHINLPEGETLEAAISVDTTRQVKDTKLTFSRIVLADGTMPDIRKSLVEAK